ncbi:MAG: TetR/AcrR family transcriptional regulator [Aggregatilineales bacterium]
MVTKGEKTREMIVHEAALLFNIKGYDGTSMNDLIDATGIKKGGIYRHFAGKEEIVLEAFDYAIRIRNQEMRDAMSRAENAVDGLLQVARTFLGLVTNPVIPGGCPILNTAIEADDKLPPLKERAQKAMDDVRWVMQYIVSNGIEQGELRPYTNGDVVATVVISLVEGALMMSKLYDDTVHLHRALDHIAAYAETLKG